MMHPKQGIKSGEGNVGHMAAQTSIDVDDIVDSLDRVIVRRVLCGIPALTAEKIKALVTQDEVVEALLDLREFG